MACLTMAAFVAGGRSLLEGGVPALPRLLCLSGAGAAGFGLHMFLFHRRWLQARISYVRGFKRDAGSHGTGS
jgi:hypothetical protein